MPKSTTQSENGSILSHKTLFYQLSQLQLDQSASSPNSENRSISLRPKMSLFPDLRDRTSSKTNQPVTPQTKPKSKTRFQTTTKAKKRQIRFCTKSPPKSTQKRTSEEENESLKTPRIRTRRQKRLLQKAKTVRIEPSKTRTSEVFDFADFGNEPKSTRKLLPRRQLFRDEKELREFTYPLIRQDKENSIIEEETALKDLSPILPKEPKLKGNAFLNSIKKNFFAKSPKKVLETEGKSQPETTSPLRNILHQLNLAETFSLPEKTSNPPENKAFNPLENKNIVSPAPKPKEERKTVKPLKKRTNFENNGTGTRTHPSKNTTKHARNTTSQKTSDELFPLRKTASKRKNGRPFASRRKVEIPALAQARRLRQLEEKKSAQRHLERARRNQLQKDTEAKVKAKREKTHRLNGNNRTPVNIHFRPVRRPPKRNFAGNSFKLEDDFKSSKAMDETPPSALRLGTEKRSTPSWAKSQALRGVMEKQTKDGRKVFPPLDCPVIDLSDIFETVGNA